MEYLMIRFGDRRTVMISGVARGSTNELIQVEAGTHRISLAEPQDFSPALQKVVVKRTTVLTPMLVDFQMSGPLSFYEEPDSEHTHHKRPRGKRKTTKKTTKKTIAKKTAARHNAAAKKTTPKKAAARPKAAAKKTTAKKAAARPKTAVKRKPRDAS